MKGEDRPRLGRLVGEELFDSRVGRFSFILGRRFVRHEKGVWVN